MLELLHDLKQLSPSPLGDYVEFGVYNGTSMSCVYSALSRMHINHVRLFGFDSFQGLPKDVQSEDGGVFHAGQFCCPKDVAMLNLTHHGVPADRISLIEGWYRDTLVGPPAAYGINRISLALIDCDTYNSARLALRFIYPALDTTSALIFDDWKLNDLDILGMGEFRAFNEFLDDHPDVQVTPMRGYSRKSKIFVLKKPLP
jgi:hypothetical protein